MKSANRPVGPISYALLGIGCLATLVMTWFMATAELVPAQVFPAPRESGESFVGQLEPARKLMMAAASAGSQFIVDGLQQIRPMQVAEESNNPNPPQQVLPKNFAQWKEGLEKAPPQPGYVNELSQAVGGEANLEKMVNLVLTDPNYNYYAYSLFLALAMLASAIAIQAVGRQDSEEITVLPSKK